MPDAEDEAQKSEETDYAKCTVAELKEHCKKAGLKVSGSKAELLDRLKAGPAAAAAQESDSPTDALAAGASTDTPAVAPVEAAAAATGAESADAPEEAATAPAANEPAAAPAASESVATDDAAAKDKAPEARDASPAPAEGAEASSAGGPEDAAVEEAEIEETVPARVARIWTEHAAKDEKLVNADRLTISSAYRQWSKTAELGLPEGTGIPAFTDVWLALNTKPSAKAKLKAAPAAGEGDRTSRDRGPTKDRSGQEQCGDFKRGRCRRGANCRYSHDIDGGQDRQDGSSEAQPPLSTANKISGRRRRPEQALGGRADDSADPLADFAAEAHTIYKKDGTAEDADEDNAKPAGGGASALESELDRRAEKRAERFAPGDSAAGESRLDQALPDSKDEKRRRGDREPRGGREPEFGTDKCMEMFDTALKEICKEGLQRELPVTASVFNDRMRRLFRGFHIEKTPFQRYGDLLKAAEEKGLIKVEKRRTQLEVTWIKYEYHVLPPRSPPRGDVENRHGRSRSRPRGAASRGNGKGAGRSDGKAAGRGDGKAAGRGDAKARGRGEQRERDRSRGRGLRAPRANLKPERRRRSPRGDGEAPETRAKAKPGGKKPGGLDRANRGKKGERAPDRKRDRKRGRESSSDDYSYSYDYTDDEDYSSLSPSPPRARRRSRSKRRR